MKVSGDMLVQRRPAGAVSRRKPGRTTGFIHRIGKESHNQQAVKEQLGVIPTPCGIEHSGGETGWKACWGEFSDRVDGLRRRGCILPPRSLRAHRDGNRARRDGVNDSKFWQLIEVIDRDALTEGDDEAAVEPLVAELEQCTAGEIEQFESLLAQRLYDLDGQVYAEMAGVNGGSSDAFLYARCYVVASGRERHEAVKADPTEMPQTLDEWCEALLSVSPRAWAAVTGNGEEEWDFVPPVSYETGSNAAAWSE